LVTRGLGGLLEVTRGLGGPSSFLIGRSLIHIAGNGLLIDVYKAGDGLAYLKYADHNNAFITELPMTPDQLSGLDWAIIKVVRQGSSVVVTMDKDIVGTFPLSSVLTYSGKMTIAYHRTAGVFDVRSLSRVISKEASDYYVESLDEENGRAVLPLFGTHSVTTPSRPNFSMPVGGVGDDSNADDTTLYFHGGTLKLNVYISGPAAYLNWDDGDNNHTVELPVTAGQLSGNDWIVLNIQRQALGTSEVLNVYLDKTLVTSITLAMHKTYGGRLNMLRSKEDGMFDIRVIPAIISENAIVYYNESISEEAGHAVLPKQR
jgi:hypothetical protein